MKTILAVPCRVVFFGRGERWKWEVEGRVVGIRWKKWLESR
jgi:hypothetical protein